MFNGKIKKKNNNTQKNVNLVVVIVVVGKGLSAGQECNHGNNCSYGVRKLVVIRYATTTNKMQF